MAIFSLPSGLNKGRLALQIFDPFDKCLQRRLDDDRLGQAVGDGLLSLKTIASDAQDDLPIMGNSSLLDELACHGYCDAASRLGEDPLGAPQKRHRLGNFAVTDILGPAAGLAHYFDGKIAIRRVANG